MKRVGRVARRSQHLVYSPAIVVKVLLVLGADSFFFGRDAVIKQQWRLEKPAEHVKRVLHLRRVNVKMVVRRLLVCERIGRPTVSAEELGKLRLVGVLLRTQKQHVLEQVC